MNKSRQERIEEPEGRHSHPYAVHHQCADKVLHDDATATASNPQSFDQLRKITSNQDHIRALPSYISSRSHGDTDIGLHEGWSVIDSVADHRDVTTLATQLSHPLCFLLW